MLALIIPRDLWLHAPGFVGGELVKEALGRRLEDPHTPYRSSAREARSAAAASRALGDYAGSMRGP